MTLRFGQQESPNACLLCHREKDGHWVAGRLQSWWSKPAEPPNSDKTANRN
jgi:hypothetical protein